MSRQHRRDRRAEDRRGQYRHGHQNRGGCGFGGALNRVVSKSRELTGMSRGMVIAAYVLGFIFVPLLAGGVLLVMLYWSSFPDDAHRNADRLSRHARRAARKMGAGFVRATRPWPATEPDLADLDFDVADEPPEASRRRRSTQRNRRPEPAKRDPAEPDPAKPDPARPSAPANVLRERFENLEQRARDIEEFVSSEEYRLQREFDKMDADHSKPSSR